jgi:hypothetical protein
MEPISFRPNDLDAAAIEQIKARHPFLTTMADVLRYALHMINTIEKVEGAETPLPTKSWTPEQVEELRKKLKGMRLEKGEE